jgi:hypothetical protein
MNFGFSMLFLKFEIHKKISCGQVLLQFQTQNNQTLNEKKTTKKL